MEMKQMMIESYKNDILNCIFQEIKKNVMRRKENLFNFLTQL